MSYNECEVNGADERATPSVIWSRGVLTLGMQECSSILQIVVSHSIVQLRTQVKCAPEQHPPLILQTAKRPCIAIPSQPRLLSTALGCPETSPWSANPFNHSCISCAEAGCSADWAQNLEQYSLAQEWVCQIAWAANMLCT
jgi:hypothetical protein